MIKSQMYFQESKRKNVDHTRRKHVNKIHDELKIKKVQEAKRRFWKSVRLAEEFKAFMELTRI